MLSPKQCKKANVLFPGTAGPSSLGFPALAARSARTTPASGRSHSRSPAAAPHLAVRGPPEPRQPQQQAPWPSWVKATAKLRPRRLSTLTG